MVLKMENKKHIALRAFSKNKTTASLQLRKLRGFLVTELNFFNIYGLTTSSCSDQLVRQRFIVQHPQPARLPSTRQRGD